MPSSVLTQRHQEFIQFLVETRKATGVAQVQLAECLGRPQRFVSKIERGERRLDAIELCQFAEALGREAAKLLEQIAHSRAT